MAEERTILLKLELDVNQLNQESRKAANNIQSIKTRMTELKAANQEGGVEYAKLREQLRRNNKTLRDNQKALETNRQSQKVQTGSLKEMREQLSAMTFAYDNLSKEQRENGAEGRRLRNDILGVTNELKKQEKALGNSRRSVGDYENALAKTKDVLLKVGSAIGVFQLLKGSINTVIEFEQAQAKLAGVLGTNIENVSELSDLARKLGAVSSFTAGQVVELQTELAKLGFDSSDIQDMTKSVLELSEAFNIDLSQAAAISGATLKQFGLAASESQRVTDVMAKSFSSSALDIKKFQDSMATVGPVANNAGFSLEQTVGILGVLSDNGIKASTSGTGLKNVFLELSKQGLTLNGALDKIENATDKNKAAMELFGKEGATVAVVMANNRDATSELTEELLLSSGAAEAAAEVQRDTLGGALKQLRSAWEEQVLAMNEAGGAGDSLKLVIQFLTENIGTIIKAVVEGVKIWAAYKAITLASAAANKVMGSSFADVVRQQGPLKGAINGVRGSFNKLGASLKSNIFGIVLLGIAKFIEALNVVETAEERLIDIQGRLDDAAAQSAVQFEEETTQLNVLVGAIKETNQGTSEREQLIKKLNETYGTNLENIQDEKKFLQELDSVQKEINKNIESKIKLQEVQARFTAISNELIQLEVQQDRVNVKIGEASQSVIGEFVQGFGDYENTKGVLEEQFDENEKLINDLAIKKEAAKKELTELLSLQAQGQAVPPPPTTVEGETAEEQDESNKKAAEKRLRDAMALAERIRKLTLDNQRMTLDAERKALEAHFRFLEATNEGHVEELLKIEQMKNRDFEELEAREQQATVDRINSNFQKETEGINERSELFRQLEIKKNQQIEAVQVEFANRAEERALATQRREEALIEQRQKEEEEKVALKIKTNDEIAILDAEEALRAAKGMDNELEAFKELQEAKIQAIKDRLAEEIKEEGLTAEQIILLQKRAAAEINKVDDETLENKKQNNEKETQDNLRKVEVLINAAQQLAGTLLQIAKNRTQEEINVEEEKNEASTELLQSQLDQGVINQTQFNDQKAALDAQFDKKSAELKKKQFNRDKASAIIEAGIATALGVAKALPNVVLSALAGAIGLAQIAVIASQPTPKFEKGGQAPLKSGVFGGERHSSGGTRGSFEDGTQVEVEKGEAFFILNRKATANISQLSNHNMKHGGVPLMQNGGVLKFQGGGALATSVSRPIDDRFESQNNAIQIAKALPPPVVDIQDILDKGAEVSNVAVDANF